MPHWVSWKRKTTVILGISFVVVVILGWQVTKLVLAENEATLYVFPSVVAGEGFWNADASLGQDLSPDALLPDFNTVNSAHMEFGNEEIIAKSSDAVATGTEALPSPSAPEETEPSPAFPIGNDGIMPNPFAPTSPDIESNINILGVESATTTELPTLLNLYSPKTALAQEASGDVLLSPQIIPMPEVAGDTGSEMDVPPALPPVVTSPYDALPSGDETASSSGEGDSIESATSSPATPSPIAEMTRTEESRDPRSVATCAIMGRTCHFMEYTGFGLGSIMDEKSFRSATLEVSLATKGPSASSQYDRVILRGYHAGRWSFLGESAVRGDVSNGKRGGYARFDLAPVMEWGDLSDLRIVLEYDRASGEERGEPASFVYVDGLWVNVKYERDLALSDNAPEDIALLSQNVKSTLLARDAEARKSRRDALKTFDGQTISFTHTDEHPTASLVVKTDKDIYHALGTANMFFSVTNDGEDTEEVRLQFHFPDNPDSLTPGRVTKLARYAYHVPYRRGALLHDPVAYFCGEGWQKLPGEEGQYSCALSEEVLSCDSMNEDGTNCIVKGGHVSLRADEGYRESWVPVELSDGSYHDAEGVFEKAINFIAGELPERAIPDSQRPVSYGKDTLLLLPGQTAYFEATVDVPFNARGEVYIEVAGKSGAYGLTHSEWDGSWNYRIPVSVNRGEGDTDDHYAVSISLGSLPEAFWHKVLPGGEDIRFVDEFGVHELPYWLSSFDASSRTGTAWVSVPRSSTGTSSHLWIYFGDKNAPSLSDEFAPFRTGDPTPRAVVFGKSGSGMSLLAQALTDNVRVVIEGKPEEELSRGEGVLFSDVAPGTFILADGPASYSVISGDESASVVPMGFSGQEFILPPIARPHEIAMTTTGEEVHVAIGLPEDALGLSLSPGSIISTPISPDSAKQISADDPMLAELRAGDGVRALPLYPETKETLYGFAVGKSTVSFARDVGKMTAICGSGARKSVDGRRAGSFTTLDHCVSGALSEADPVLVGDISGRVAVVSEHTNGSTLSEYLGSLPGSEFSSTYILPVDAKDIAVLCAPAYGSVDVGIVDSEGTLLSSAHCEPREHIPGKAFLSPPTGYFPIGTFLTSIGTTTPFHAVVSEAGGGSAPEPSRLRTLFGGTLSRGASPKDPVIEFGDPSFVIPGEHRKLDVEIDGAEKPHVNKFLSKNREFSGRQLPGFVFEYTPRAGTITSGLRDILQMKPFTVKEVSFRQKLFGNVDVPHEILYGENNTWSLTIKESARNMIRPGKYTLHIEVEEGGETYVDEYDFYWGILAMNFDRTVYESGETADILLAALSDNGNTICDARLKLWVTDPTLAEHEVPVTSSGQCNGNNVVDVPDYSASFTTSATGTYAVRVVRLDANDNIASQTSDSFTVFEKVPVEIIRTGPTRIYPVAHYPMKIRVRSNEAYNGALVEKIPGNFVIIDRGNANLEWGDEGHTFMTATWNIDLPAGGVIDLAYTFDAPDISPYLYELGPITLSGSYAFTEYRAWQIASDAAGKMMLFWDGGVAPVGWTCVSCLTTDPFYQRLVVGSSTYNTTSGVGGTATHTPTAVATVDVTGSAGVGSNATNNTNNAPLAHTHTLTPQISGVSNYPAYTDLRVIQANSAGDPGTIPAGAIGIFDVASSSLPSGWYRYAPIDGRYIRGHTSVGTTGGANTHSHTATGTLAAPPQSGIREQNGVVNGATDFAHTHTLSATNTDVLSGEPPYTEVIFARMTVASGTPNYLISMWSDTPPDGWASVSADGETLNGKFLKASTTYGGTGGALTHQHANISSATTSAENNSNNYTANINNAQAPAGHIHNVNITSFSTDSNLPPYIDVILAKRLSGIQIYTGDSFWFYANANATTPTDPWPTGGSDYAENEPVNTSGDSIKYGEKLRIRMNVDVANATTSTSSQAFKLQYVDATDCANALNWTDVGAIGSSGLWRGANNTPADGATLSSNLLSSSTVSESYEEENNSALNPNAIPVRGVGEWDWVVEHHGATSSSLYCFRMTLSDGTPFARYMNYPQILTNASPNTPVPSSPFSYEKVGTTTPEFQLAATDPEGNDIDYEVQVSLSATFTTSIIDSDSIANPELFENVPNPSNKAPFNSGDLVQFTSATALTNGNTYWWRVRAKDVSGSNAWGSWTTAQSFTVDTGVTVSTWHQTTREQFQLDTASGVNASNTDRVMLNVGSTTGSLISPQIDFSLATVGTVWGSLSFTDVETGSDLKYQVQYLTPTSSWALIPESALSGNNVGFDTSPVSLLGVDSTVYTSIRIVGNFTNITQTPILNDWTIAWGYNIETPTPYLPFDNQKVATRTPAFEFMTTDPQGDDLYYEFSWSTTSAFTSSTTRNSGSDPGFQNLTNPPDTSPFTSGDRIRYTIQTGDILASSTTYFWRVRAKDPLGANTFSFWSPIRSITVDTTVTVGTWFQTVNDQFNTDTLSSMYAFSNGSTTVATTTDEIMLAYGEGTVQTPRYRIWNGASLGGELSALSVGAQISWVVMRASPIIGQYILGTLGADRDTNFQVYENGAWGNLNETGTNGPSLTRRSFDVAYETLSGRAITVTCDGNPDPKYQIWTGSAWSATGTVNLGFTSNCEWVRLASSPISNEIIGLFRNTGNQYEAQVWNATSSSWGTSTTLGSMTEIAHEGMAVEYEASGNQALVVTSNGNSFSFAWKAWDGTNWSGVTNTNIGDDFEWGNLRRNVGDDSMALCYVDEDGDVGVMRWSGSAWNGFNAVVDELDATPPATSDDRRPIDCQYETMTGMANYIWAVYSNVNNTMSRLWNTTAWQTAQFIATTTNMTESFTVQSARSYASGTIASIFLDHVGGGLVFAAHTGSSSWSDIQVINSSLSVTGAPYGEPFYMASKNPTTIGTIIGTAVDFDDGLAPAWSSVSWSVTTPGSSNFKVQVEYQDQTTGVWALVPDAVISGNSTGTTSSPIAITLLDTNTYNVLRLKGTATCVSGNCPVLHDWTVQWAAGVRISGIARAHDRTTLVTSGTVAVAVNGVLQSGKTGTISGGNWFIDNVTVFPGNVLTVFVDGVADFNEAVSDAKYTGPGDMGGMSLNERWLTIGSASTTGQTIALYDIARYDNSTSGDEDIFFDVDAGNDYNNCVTGTCLDSSIYVYSNTFRPATSTSETINTWDMRIESYLYAETNTFKVAGDWRNLGGFTANLSTIVFNATSGVRTIDSSGSATSTFYNITFGEAGGAATTSLLSSLTATGTMAINYGTTSPGVYALTIQGDLSIGSSGGFYKGTATTTFSGATAKTWTDNTTAKQDLGNILIDGTAKTITLGSGVKASNVTIGADDTLNAGGANTITVIGYWENGGTFTAQTGTVAFATTSPGVTINQGLSNLYNVSFTGVGGTWRWLNTNATATNNMTIASGAVTLPSGTLAIGGTFDNSGGAFTHNSGVVKMTSTASGKNVRAGGSDFNDLVFAGSGGTWTFLDTNATTSGTLSVVSGAPTFPSGVLAVGVSFLNQGGSFTANGGTIKMTSGSGSRSITLLGSSLAGLHVSGGATFTITDTNATTTGDVLFSGGTTILPAGVFAVGGGFVSTATFTAGTGSVILNAGSGTKTVNPGNSSFNILAVNGNGSFTVAGNATTTQDFRIERANAFTLNSGLTFAVNGTFTNLVGGASTTWAGSILHLNSGTSYTMNTKTLGGDAYGILKLSAGTLIRAWNSSATTYDVNATASLYSQDHAGIDGDLYIFGNYTRVAGSDYWDYATDFDGTTLGGSSRQVNVRFASGASANFSDSSLLTIVGTSTASTTIDRQSSGNYNVTVASSTVNAQYYKFKNLDVNGFQLLASTTITSLSNGDYELDVNGGTLLTMSSSTIMHNNGLQIFRVRFALGSAGSGFNVTETGTAPVEQYIRFKEHYGNIAGESFDVDSGGNPGNIRWDDSNFVISVSGTVYSDAGVTRMTAPSCDGVTPNVSIRVNGGASFSAPCQGSGVATGTFTVSGVTFQGDVVLTVYLNTGGVAKAVTITRSPLGDLTGIDLYQNRVILRHEDVFPMSIAEMDFFDEGDDTDIPFVTSTTSSPYTLTVRPETELWIWNSKTFIPGGNITLQSGGSGNNWDGKFHVDNNAVFTGANGESHSVGGGFSVDSGAVFTSASSTFTFTATTSGKIITGIAPLSFQTIDFNGSGGSWSVNQDMAVGGTMTVTAGTVGGIGSISVSGTNVTGAGTIAMTGGTFSLLNGGFFGGGSDWSFSNLIFGNGTIATTTKIGSSTITVSGLMTIATAQSFIAGTPSAYTFSGGGTPLFIKGTFDAGSTIVRYSSPSATTIATTTYHRLFLAPSGAGNPTYQIATGTIAVNDYFAIGDGINPVSVNADINDPSVNAYGNVLVRASSTLVASNVAPLNVYRDWVNLGSFTPSDGTVSFLATTTGHTIIATTSPFYNMVFNSATGGWTIGDNATATHDFTLTAGNTFTVASGTMLEVGGTFTNAIGGSATTWTGTILHLNSGASESINTKTTGADEYETLMVGANTKVKMWNSSATTTTVNASGSLYSQNHAGVSGDLTIWGAYTLSSGADYWSTDKDFDGTALVATARAPRVRFAPSASYTLSGTGALEVLGTSTATTTIDRSSTGNYAINISGGSTTMRYYSLRNMDANGLNISGSPLIESLSDGDFELSVNTGSMITVAGATIDYNPLMIFKNNRFATSSGISSGYNVKATGVSASAWRFNLSYGNYAGEAYDSDPAGDPGYIIWDDSAANITISGNVYEDEGVTAMNGQICNGVTQNVRLKVQGGGSFASACNASGAFSISNVVFNPGDTLTLFLDTNGTTTGANVSIDPATNISNMHIYRNRVIVRHEGGTAIAISNMDQYDHDQDTDIPFKATAGSPNTLVLSAGTKLIVWNSKVFAPGGNVTVAGNAQANAVDGSVELYATSTWSASGSETHTIGGLFLAQGGASVAPANSTFVFNATTSGKSISASSSLTFYNMTFSGAGGTWDMAGVGTSSNNISITAGTTTLPSGTLAVGGSFDNSGGAFAHNNGTVKFTAVASGKNIRVLTSTFSELLFAGTGGGWTFLDTNATTTGSVTISAGGVTFPSGTLAVGADLNNLGGTISANNGTLKMYATSSGRIIKPLTSSLANVLVSDVGTFDFPDGNATTTGDLILASGTTTLASSTMTIGGSFYATGTFSAGVNTVVFNPSAGTKNVAVGTSTFYNVVVSGSATTTFIASATATNMFTISSGNFRVFSGATLAVGGTFTNGTGGISTTWTGGTLKLYSGTSFNMNGKTTGGDTYGTLELDANTNVRSWNSSASSYAIASSASLYSQDHAGVDGDLYVFGNYARTSGTDYWSYATDFDGTALGGSGRQVDVRFANNATSSYSNGAALEIIGSSTASTTVNNQGSGSFGISLTSATLNAQYYQIRNTNGSGLSLLGTTTITSLNFGEFTLDTQSGTSITIASTTIDQNASALYTNVSFATSSGVSGINVFRTGTTTNAITFGSESGNISGETYDEDGSDGCGSIRWTDSSCLISDQRSFRWRNDDGAEGALASEWYNASWSRRQRVRLTTTATTTVTNVQVKFDVPYDSDMQADFDDLRFTDSGGTTSIPFWIESVITSATATVWAKIPSLPASSYADIFMYYGNGGVGSLSSGTTTFSFFDDFEDNDIAEYSGNTTLFANSASFNYERTYGLAPSSGNTGAKTTDGIAQASAGVGRNMTFRFFQYIDATKNDEPCFLFAVQAPVTNHQNYAVCLEPFGSDKVSIAKDVSSNSRGGTVLATTSVTFSSGWYEATVDWLSSGNEISVKVYDNTGALFATTSTSNSSYTTGGVGFSFWGQNGGWDIPLAKTYNPAVPTATFYGEQQDSGATWKVAENTTLQNQPQGTNVRLRLTVKNSGTPLTNENFRLQVASKGASANCESVATGNYTDVPTNSGGCGSAVACMEPSAQYSDKASTTQLLSIPTGFSFTSGQILEDPSNQTGNISLAYQQFTELEYNFQLTAFAVQNAYCFRTTKAGTPLDNYTKVAELTVLHPPVISDLTFNRNSSIALTEGTTTIVSATATVTDLNGYTDLLSATTTFYRSSVSGGNACTDNDNDCYNATSTCSYSDCSGNSCIVTCSAYFRYFADPTDAGSLFPSDTWQALLDVWDTSYNHATSSAGQELYTLRAFTIPSAINYGTLTVGSDTGNTNSTTTVTNTGNTILDMLLGGDNMFAGTSQIPYYNQKYATSTFTYSSCPICTVLSASTSPTFIDLNVTKPTTTSAYVKDVYWGLLVPFGSPASTYNGLNIFTAN